MNQEIKEGTILFPNTNSMERLFGDPHKLKVYQVDKYHCFCTDMVTGENIGNIMDKNEEDLLYYYDIVGFEEKKKIILATEDNLEELCKTDGSFYAPDCLGYSPMQDKKELLAKVKDGQAVYFVAGEKIKEAVTDILHELLHEADFKKGDIVYAINGKYGSGIVQTTVSGYYVNGYGNVRSIKCDDKWFVDRNGAGIAKTCGSAFRLETEVFCSPEEAWDACMKKQEKKRAESLEEYRDEIENLEDLIRFPLSHCLCGDEDDPVAREVYEERAKEILAEMDKFFVLEEPGR